nr:hypothetical protein [Tanacetum cinerariifolium]
MAILVSLDSSKESIGTSIGRVILFGTILTTATPTISLPTTHTNTTEIPTVLPTVLPTVPPSLDHTPAFPDITHASPNYSPASPNYLPISPDYTPASPDYSPASDTDTTDSDAPDTPPSPTHATPFTEITFSTQRSHVIHHRRVMILAPRHPIPYHRPYRYHLNGPFHMLTARKRVGPLPTHRLAVRHSVDQASLDFHLDASSDSSSRHSLPDHSSLDLPSTSARPSRKRCRSLMTYIPALSPVSGALSPVRVDLIPSPKMVIEGVQREQGCRIVGVESAVTTFTERIAELEKDNRRLKGTTSVAGQRVDQLQHGMSRMQRAEADTTKMPNIRSGACMTQEEVEELVSRRVAEEMEARNDLTAYTQRFQELILLCNRMVPDEEDRVERFVGGLPDNIQGNVIAANSARLQDAIRIANQLMDKKLQGYVARSAENKRGMKGPCTMKCNNYKKVGHQTRDCRSIVAFPNTHRATLGNQQVVICYECERPRHVKRDCPKLRNQYHRNKVGNKTRNKTGNNEPTTRAYAIGRGGANPDSNVVIDTSYVVELANERISKTNIILRECTLGLLGHSFDINLMLVELGSFDIIIGMDLMAKNYAVIVCDEKVIRIPYGDEVLIFKAMIRT